MAFFLSNSCQYFIKVGLIFLVLVVEFQLSFVSKVVAMETVNLNSSSIAQPKLEIGIFDSFSLPDEFQEIKNDEPFVHTSKILGLLIYCRATYPIEWRFTSQQFQKRTQNILVAVRDESENIGFLSKLHQAYIARQFSQVETDRVGAIDGGEENSPRIFGSPKVFYYLAVVITPAQGLYGQIGSCQSISQPNSNSNAKFMDSKVADEPKNPVLASRLNLFTRAATENSGFRLSTGLGRRFKIINRRPVTRDTEKVKESSTGFLIPCPSTSNAGPTQLKVSLHQIFNEGTPNENLTAIPSAYDHRAGFYLWGRNELEGTFQCQAEGAAPNSAGTTKVTFEFIQNTGQYRNQQEDWLEVSRVAQTPDFERTTNDDATAGIKISREKDEAKCTSNYTKKSNADSLSFLRIGCENRVECGVHRYCSAKVCNSFTTEADPCSGGNGNCLVSRYLKKSELWKCTFGGNQVSTFSFAGLDDQQYYFDDKDALPRSALIQLNRIEENENGQNLHPSLSKSVLHTNRRHKFICSASKFLFTPELILLGQLSDGTRVRFPGESAYTRSGFLSTKLEMSVEVTLTSDMIGVTCLAPWSNSSEWFEETRTFNIRDVVPKIRELDGAERTFHVGNSGKNLSCYTMADPKPIFKWLYENKTEIGGNSGFSTTFVDDGVILHFPSIIEDHQGSYICDARNENGKDRREFGVSVKPKVETQTESTTDKVVETGERDKNSTCCTTELPKSTLTSTDFAPITNKTVDGLTGNVSSDSTVLVKNFMTKTPYMYFLSLHFYYLFV